MAGLGNVIGGAAVIANVSAADVAVKAFGAPESVTFKVTWELPAQEALGVPPMDAPEADCVIVRQAGSVPLASDQEYGGMPPVAVSDCV